MATRAAPGRPSLTPADEHDLRFRGILVFLDPPKPDARGALRQFAGLGITVKILTGDNPAVAAKVCADLGLPPGRVATGADIDRAGDRLAGLIARSTVFARVSPEHKAQVIRAQRRTGTDVAFLGDGVNDAVALHTADVGISANTGSTGPTAHLRHPRPSRPRSRRASAVVGCTAAPPASARTTACGGKAEPKGPCFRDLGPWPAPAGTDQRRIEHPITCGCGTVQRSAR